MDGLDILLSRPDRTSSRSDSRLPSPKRPRRSPARLVPFFLVVVLPCIAAGWYLFAIATHQYVSEARFVVRGAGQQAPGLLSSLLQSAGASRAQDDTYAVQDYILSRDALQELVQGEGIKDVFNRPEADLLSRFPNPVFEDNFEFLYRHYLRHVDVKMDTTTGVSELTVVTYRPDDSRRIASALLAAGERLVNRMNDRQRENALRDARKEVQIAEARVLDVSSRIAEFRNREALLDPNRQSIPMLQAITTLQTRLSSLKLEMSQMQPNSPLLPGARQRAVALQAQIDEARSKITGSDSSLVPKIRDFDLLMFEREFGDKQLASATASLESARINADRQQLYLELIVKPLEADYALYPKRFVSLAIVFATLLGVYVMGGLLVAGAREHRLS